MMVVIQQHFLLLVEVACRSLTLLFLRVELERMRMANTDAT